MDIEAVLNYLVEEQKSGNLNENTLKQYSQELDKIMDDNKDDEKFVSSMRGLFKDVGELNESKNNDEEEEKEIIDEYSRVINNESLKRGYDL